MKPEENKTFFENYRLKLKDNPWKWGLAAYRLKAAADVLFEACANSRTAEGEPIHEANTELDEPAMMLLGMAVENYIKGYLVKKFGGNDNAFTQCKTVWREHDLAGLVVHTGLVVSEAQKLILSTLSGFVRWAGRFPTSIKPEEFTIEKQLDAADYMTPGVLLPSQARLLDPLLEELQRGIFGRDPLSTVV